ncbi:hypothetical protein LY76DRAFT_597231 [Colletotrichum caudatum]|nr:hypothetical protein LY76DRAFT_597231 [Colletotrichum caudatum]
MFLYRKFPSAVEPSPSTNNERCDPEETEKATAAASPSVRPGYIMVQPPARPRRKLVVAGAAPLLRGTAFGGGERYPMWSEAAQRVVLDNISERSYVRRTRWGRGKERRGQGAKGRRASGRERGLLDEGSGNTKVAWLRRGPREEAIHTLSLSLSPYDRRKSEKRRLVSWT